MKKVLLTETQLKDVILSLVAKILNVDEEKLKKEKIDTKKIEDKLGDFLKNKEEEESDSELEGDVDSNWMKITRKVIDKLEGGYWNPVCGHPTSKMGKSTETMFGLDRFNGNIESTEDGKKFFKIIDNEKKRLGMRNFCKTWKWLYRGGELEDKLEALAAKIMKHYFDRNMENYVKDSNTKNKILKNKGLLLHMSYASWNGPGFFQRFAKSLEQGVKKGMSNTELIDLAIKDRSNSAVRSEKVANLIRNPEI
jgi:hypothetical protein